MSIVEDVRRHYEANGISVPVTTPFKCKHLDDCKRCCARFTEGSEAYIGGEYEKGLVPRLLFLSLDPGSNVDDKTGKEWSVAERTIDGGRAWEEKLPLDCLPKNRHWFRTHELAWRLLKQFIAPPPEPPPEPDIKPYFAHTQSVKCCMNKSGKREADYRLYKNCREYIPGEVAALRPDIVVTQGIRAMEAIQASFPGTAMAHPKHQDRDHMTLDLEGRQVLWILTYHPRNYGGFNRQRRDRWQAWEKAAAEFVAGRHA